MNARHAESRVVRIPADAIIPAPAAMARPLGLPPGGTALQRMTALVDAAFALLAGHAAPIGIVREVHAGEFPRIYAGEGRNEAHSPLASIAPRADSLALFAVTLGSGVSRAIDDLFSRNDFALGHALDAAASAATELAAEHLRHRHEAETGGTSLHYSPGYCGWHVSGQRALFAALHPEEVGIRLRESCLMEPLKSISGVLVAGPAVIHRFEPSFTFCSACLTRTCRRRMRDLAGDATPNLSLVDRRIAGQ